MQLETESNSDHDLKQMLQEGKQKLEQALKRSLENEQKIIKYEHEIEQKVKQINDMENLLKVRDGLIGMMKTKKDEIAMENDSLNRYAEEIRQLLLEVILLFKASVTRCMFLFCCSRKTMVASKQK